MEILEALFCRWLQMGWNSEAWDMGNYLKGFHSSWFFLSNLDPELSVFPGMILGMEFHWLRFWATHDNTEWLFSTEILEAPFCRWLWMGWNSQAWDMGRSKTLSAQGKMRSEDWEGTILWFPCSSVYGKYVLDASDYNDLYLWQVMF